MSGTINLALTQQFDMDGRPLSGGLLYFFAAGTTTPQSAFQDPPLTILHPNPIVLDASGRVPMFYLADGFIKIRLTDENGVVIIAADQLLVIGPSSGSGGGGTIDATTVMQTGDIKARFGVDPGGGLGGFVRCNGNTIGSAVSGATERANADCQALFEYLWGTNTVGVFAGVTPSRGASANADWVANKRIEIPDLRGRTLSGLDDMGSSPASRLTTTFLGTSPIVLGNAGGNQSQTISAAQLPSHTHSGGGATGSTNIDHGHSFTWSGTTGDDSPDHTHNFTAASAGGGTVGGGAASLVVGTFTTAGANQRHQHAYSGSSTTGGMNGSNPHNHGFSFTTNGGDATAGQAHNNVPPTMVLTFYIKL